VVQYLSPQWIAALDDAATRNPALVDTTAGVALTIEQVVTGAAGDTVWHVTINDGTVRFIAGPAPDADGTPVVRFTTDQTTARAVTDGDLTVQEAFMRGRLQVGGDTAAVVAHHDVLAGLGDVFAAVELD
jgi:hypothetical protein